MLAGQCWNKPCSPVKGPRHQKASTCAVIGLVLVFAVAALQCSSHPRAGESYRFRPTGDTVHILTVGTISEVKQYHAADFHADSLARVIGRSLARLDSMKPTTGGAVYTASRDSLLALQRHFLSVRIAFDDSLSEYVQCCSFRQYNMLIVIPVDELNRSYERIER